MDRTLSPGLPPVRPSLSPRSPPLPIPPPALFALRSALSYRCPSRRLRSHARHLSAGSGTPGSNLPDDTPPTAVLRNRLPRLPHTSARSGRRPECFPGPCSGPPASFLRSGPRGRTLSSHARSLPLARFLPPFDRVPSVSLSARSPNQFFPARFLLLRTYPLSLRPIPPPDRPPRTFRTVPGHPGTHPAGTACCPR